jgi:hypothetical protein
VAQNDGPSLELLQRLSLEQAKELQRLKSAGGGGTSGDGMEPRLAKLEAQMEHVQADLAKLANVPVDIATIKGEMVTKDYLNSAFDKHLRWTLGIVGLMIAIATVINALVHH